MHSNRTYQADKKDGASPGRVAKLFALLAGIGTSIPAFLTFRRGAADLKGGNRRGPATARIVHASTPETRSASQLGSRLATVVPVDLGKGGTGVGGNKRLLVETIVAVVVGVVSCTIGSIADKTILITVGAIAVLMASGFLMTWVQTVPESESAGMLRVLRALREYVADDPPPPNNRDRG